MEDEELNDDLVEDQVVENQEAIEPSANISEDNYGYARPEDFPEEELVNVDHVENEIDEVEEEVQDEVQDEVVEEEEELEQSEEETLVNEEDNIDLSEIFQEVGLEFEDENVDIKDVLSHYKELLDSKDEGSDLPKELQLAIDSFKNGGDYMKVLNTLSLDFDNMEGKELLHNKFKQENQELYEKNQELANKKFEREFAAKYGILNNEFEDDFAKEEFMSEHGDDYDYTKMLYEQELNDSKEFLNNWKQENSSEGNVRNEMSEEDRQSIVDNYYTEVDSALQEFGGISLPIDDNGDNDFVLGADEDSIQQVEQVMKDPIEFFKETIGYDVNTGEIDVETFATTVHLLSNMDSLGSRLGQYYLEKSDKKTVESILENARTPNQPDQVRQPMEDESVSAAKAIGRALYGKR